MPQDLGLLGEYAATLGDAGRHQDMLRVARRMVELDPRHPRAYYLQAVLAARAGLDDLARRLLVRTNGAYDELPAGQLLAGVIELRSGSAALAVERFDELVRRQPENAAGQVLLGRALLAHGEANEVVARLGSAAGRPEASPYLLTLVGRAYEQMERREDAGRYLDRAALAESSAIGVPAAGTGTRGGDAAGDVALLRHLLAEGRAPEAVALARRLGERYPDSIDVEILSGDVALLAGDPAGALADYERAAEVRLDFVLVQRIAIAQQRLGREAAAVDRVAGYLAANPRSAQASLLLAAMLAGRGDERRAKLLVAHARGLDGHAAQRREGRVAATLERLAAAR